MNQTKRDGDVREEKEKGGGVDYEENNKWDSNKGGKW